MSVDIMVSCHSAEDGKHQTILNEKGRDASLHQHAQHPQRQLGMIESSPLRGGVPATNSFLTSTQSHNHFSYFSKFTVVTIIAAYAVSSASAFTQLQNQMRATPSSLLGRRQSSISFVRTKTDFLSFSSRTKLFLSKDTGSSSGSSKSDQQEWKAVFLTLQLYKAAFGDLKVPAKFVVPSAAPWPGR